MIAVFGLTYPGYPFVNCFIISGSMVLFPQRLAPLLPGRSQPAVSGGAKRGFHLSFSVFPSRLADCVEVHHEGHGASSADWSSALLCHPDVCYHWLGVLQWEVAPSLLHEQFR